MERELANLERVEDTEEHSEERHALRRAGFAVPLFPLDETLDNYLL